VVDTDGRSCAITYTNTTYISSVTDPYGRVARFYYDTSNRLAQIVDTMGMSSSFVYDSSNRITSMTTPYGTTSFEYFSETNISPHRIIRIAEPGGHTNLYAYCTTNDTPGVSHMDSAANVRNSFHWNRAQYQAISSTGKGDPLAMPYDDYKLAETRHWLLGTDEATGLYAVTDTVDAKGSAIDGNGVRTKEWFEYQGQNGSDVGTLRRISKHGGVVNAMTLRQWKFCATNLGARPMSFITTVALRPPLIPTHSMAADVTLNALTARMVNWCAGTAITAGSPICSSP
jgi:YD repeat-containing protein